MRTYAVGDIHGHLDLLKAAHARIAKDDLAHGGGGTIVHVGDLLDRGPQSREVVDYLMQGQAEGRSWVVLKGNHDRFLPRFIRDPLWVDPGLSSGQHWLDHNGLGATATLQSYGIAPGDHARVHAEARARVPQAHIDWLEGLPLSHRIDGAIFVHAGIRPHVALEDQVEDDLLWIRHGFLDDDTDHGALVVHGHTIVPQVTHFGNRLAIDTGAAHGAPISAVVFDDDGLFELTDQGRLPILPA